MKRIVCIIGLLVMLVMSGGVALSQTSAEKFDRAKSLFDQKKYSEAKVLLSEVLDAEDNPYPGTSYLLLMKCHYFLRDHASVESLYASHHTKFTGTIFDPAARFVRANSLLDNANDPTEAAAEYEYIVSNFPTSPFAAPGSLYKLGLINLERFKDYSTAREKFNQCLTEYPDSPYVPRCLLGILKAASFQRDTATMFDIYNKILSKYGSWKIIAGEAALAVAEFYNKQAHDRQNALKYYLKVINDYPGSSAEPLALLRAGDLVPYGDIKQSIELYRRCLKKYPQKKYSAWAQTELGVCYMLKGDVEQARSEFEKVLQMTTKKRYVDKANLYLEAIADPESISAIKVRYDIATRKIRDLADYDTSFWDFARVVHLAESSRFTEYLNDPGVPRSEKAELLYKLSLSYFNLEERQKAKEVTERILKEYPDQGEITALALYNKAFQLHREYKYADAIAIFQKILVDYPDFRYTPQTLQRLARCYEESGEHLTAARIHNFVIQAYPETVWAEKSRRTIKAILLGRPHIKQLFAQYRNTDNFPMLVAFKRDPIERQHKALCDFLKQVTAQSTEKKSSEKVAMKF
ncbi:tetratricopeptide repeat protein [Candidatus Sumerlaeota bacterium]|nr:tetratricopeptide repeat protein [Candidatus Sumerlaeota bacterium]